MTVEAIEEDGTRVTISDASDGTMYHTSQNIVLFVSEWWFYAVSATKAIFTARVSE